MVIRQKSVRQQWKDAFRASDLPANARLILYVYDAWVRMDDPGCRDVCVAHVTLRAETRLATNTVTRYRNLVVTTGWLTETTAATGTRAARYALTIPTAGVAAVATQPANDPKSLESQRLRLKGLREETPLCRKPAALVSQIEAPSVATIATDTPDPLLDTREDLGFRGISPRARPDPETHDRFSVDDPFDRQQDIEPPPHIAAVFAGLTATGDPGPEPVLCDHGIVRGLTLGGGELACCPAAPVRSVVATLQRGQAPLDVGHPVLE